jgi:hypothetical protein
MRAMDDQKVKLLSGGNPQIPKGYGDGPVQDFIKAAGGWKGDVARQIDTLVVRTVPDVSKAVKWNSPLYGKGDGSYFLSFHCYEKYIKVAWHNGTKLHPMPPVESRQELIRYLHVSPDEALDEVQFVDWVKQAWELPGEKM